jgi:hypothetical protein
MYTYIYTWAFTHTHTHTHKDLYALAYLFTRHAFACLFTQTVYKFIYLCMYVVYVCTSVIYVAHTHTYSLTQLHPRLPFLPIPRYLMNPWNIARFISTAMLIASAFHEDCLWKTGGSNSHEYLAENADAFAHMMVPKAHSGGNATAGEVEWEFKTSGMMYESRRVLTAVTGIIVWMQVMQVCISECVYIYIYTHIYIYIHIHTCTHKERTRDIVGYSGVGGHHVMLVVSHDTCIAYIARDHQLDYCGLAISLLRVYVYLIYIYIYIYIYVYMYMHIYIHTHT